MNQGMVKQNVFDRFELIFWNLAIHVLSALPNRRSARAKVLRAVRQPAAAAMALLFVLCGMTGLLAGYLFFVITH